MDALNLLFVHDHAIRMYSGRPGSRETPNNVSGVGGLAAEA